MSRAAIKIISVLLSVSCAAVALTSEKERIQVTAGMMWLALTILACSI